MTWGKVDDQLHSHPKPEEAKLEAMGLWVLGLSYCCAYLTDGFITPERVRRIAGNRGGVLAARLVTARLWEVVDGGWQYHDWAHYQPTREEALAERERKRTAGKKGGEAKAARVAAAMAVAVAPARAMLAEVALPPSRPVPSRPDPEEAQSGASAPAARAGSTAEQRIAAELRRHPVFASLDIASIANMLEGRRFLRGKAKPEHVITAIAECAADCVSLGLKPEPLLRKLRAYCDRARPPIVDKDTPKSESGPPAYREFEFEEGELESFRQPARKTIGGT